MNKNTERTRQGSPDEPLYNIGVVTRMTGISMATLRAWERRYSFPEAIRTSGGHRLYSEQDILRLRWVKSRIDQGMQTSQAIHALHYEEKQGHPLFPADALLSEPVLPKHTGVETSLENNLPRLIEALSARQLDIADQILGEALAASSPEQLILHLIGPALSEMGEAWEQKRISVATEHLATNYLRQRLLMWMVSGPPSYSRPPIVLACAPNEWHEGSLLILGALLRRRRWPIAYLGQNVPLSDLAAFVKDIKPQMVILVAMLEETAAEISAWPQWMPEAAQKGSPVIAYGGRIFSIQPEWRMRVPGVYLGASLEQGIEEVEQILHSHP